ncbi:MAG: UvrD-helicase domain-containing protein [Bacillota bacterium]
MAFTYTKKQQEAIDHEGENILVSAGAGSGKTAVLTERVIRKLKDGVPIHSLIILTFTNAAAAEMKMRIRKALLENVEAEPSLRQALEGLDSAHIRTFDSYAFFLLKKYGYLKGISKQLSIGDEASFSLKKETLIDAVFDRYFKQGDKDFLDYVSLFSHKDDSPAKRQILFFHEALSLYYDQEAFFQYTLKDHFTQKTFEALFSRYEAIVLEQVATMKRRLRALFDETDIEVIEEHLEALYQTLTPLFECDDYDCVHTFVVSDPKLPTTAGATRKLKDTPEESELEAIKPKLSAIKDILKKDLAGSPASPGPLRKSKADHFEGFMATQPYIQTIIAILKDFDTEYKTMQKEEEIFDFSTVARYALDLIHEHESVREALRQNTHEIMVDEYQDTNAMQEAFLSVVGNDNLYMVGDVKQSIYRFRHADPTIFMEKYMAYKDESGGHLIDLTENFRSRKEVIEGINRLFEGVMDTTVGGVSYDERQALKAKNPTYEKHRKDTVPYGVDILLYEEEESEALLEKFSKKELEMFLVAREIKAQVERKTEVATDGGLRPITYGDHAILLDRASDFETFKKVFEHVGVPISIHRNVPFIDHDEVILVRSLLTLIAAMDDDALYHASFKHAFMSVMRSFAFEMDDDAIVRQVLDFPDHPVQPHERFEAHILEPFRPFFKKVETLRQEARRTPVDELLHEVYFAFDLFGKIIRLQNTREAKARLDYMVEVARVEAQKGTTLNGFAKHLKAIAQAESDIELSLKSDFDANTVHMLTIHKSKGLEFPVVYLPHLFNTFMHDTNRERFKRSLGFLIPYDNEGYDEHFLYPLYRTMEKTEDVSERLRVLYVALTRAKERVVMPFFEPVDKETYTVDEKGLVDVYDRRRYRSFHQILMSVIERFEPNIKRVAMDDYAPDITYRHATGSDKTFESKGLEKTYRSAGETPAIERRSSYSKGVGTLVDPGTLDALDYGNKLHEVFERIDFQEPVAPQLERLGLNKKEKTLIQGFFESSLIKSLDIQRVFKEYPFALEEDEGLKSGFIDLLIETRDAFMVIDYKLKGIEEPAYEVQIEGYVSTLSALVDKRVEGYLYSILDKTFKKVV